MKKAVKDFFIPHKGNAYTPDVLQRVSVGVMAVLVLFSFALANLQALVWMSSDWMVSAVLPAVIVELTNDERVGDSLGTLRRSALLDAAAAQKANHMAQHEYFAHYSPDGISPWHWFDEVAYDFVHAGENLAVHFSASDAVVDAWMNSPGHRANILNGRYTEIGVGTAQGSYKGFPTVFVVQLFGTPGVATTVSDSVVVETNQLVNRPATDSVLFENNDEDVPVYTEVAGIDVVEMAVLEEIALEVPVSADMQGDIPDSDSALAAYDTVTDAAFLADHYVAEPTAEGVQEVLVVYSDLATTTRATMEVVQDVHNAGHASSGALSTTAALLERTATQSSSWLQLVYTALAVFVVIALVLSIGIEWRRQNPIQIAYGTGLLMVMALLWYVHTTLVGGVVIV